MLETKRQEREMSVSALYWGKNSRYKTVHSSPAPFTDCPSVPCIKIMMWPHSRVVSFSNMSSSFGIFWIIRINFWSMREGLSCAQTH